MLSFGIDKILWRKFFPDLPRAINLQSHNHFLPFSAFLDKKGYAIKMESKLTKIRKAVFPVGGLGTRFLPATKAMPKEMLAVVDKPLIQYAVEEALAAGIEEFIFVTGKGKTSIEDHFDHSPELEEALRNRGQFVELEKLDGLLPSAWQIAYTRQLKPLGLGHAVWSARSLIGDEPFAVFLADDLIVSRTSVHVGNG